MAYYLQFDGGGNYVDIPSGISLNEKVTYIRFKSGIQDRRRFIVGTVNSSAYIRINNGNLEYLLFGRTGSLPSVQENTEYLLRVAHDGVNFEVSEPTLGAINDSGTNQTEFRYIGRWFTDSDRFNGAIFYIEQYSSDESEILANYSKQTLNGSNDTLYPDTVGGNDGTLVSFPTDNSQWVFFDDGGGSVDVTITLDSGTYSLSGTDANILKDYFLTTELGSYLKEGQSVGLLSQRNLSTELGNYTYSGDYVEILYNRSLPFDTGSYTKEGSNVNLTIGRFLTAASGSYTYTGEDLDLSYSQSLTLTLGTGSYTYQGTGQDLLKDFLLPVESGNYTYEAPNVRLITDRRLSTQSGEYTNTGNSVNFIYETNGITYTLSLEEGSYLKQGTPLRILADRLLPVDTGEYLYEGSNSELLYNRVVALDSGMYSSAGTDLGKKVNRRLQFRQGNYSLVGTPITLSYTGEVLAILEGYSINYKQDAVNDCFYKQDILSIRYK